MSIDRALALLERQLPEGWHVTEISPGTSWGSRDPEGNYKPDVGAYRQTAASGWCVTVNSDGWEKERGHWFQWGRSIRGAALELAWSIRAVRRNPHLVHLGLHGPGEIQRSPFFLRSCAECVDEAARIFDNNVEWVAA